MLLFVFNVNVDEFGGGMCQVPSIELIRLGKAPRPVRLRRKTKLALLGLRIGLLVSVVVCLFLFLLDSPRPVDEGLFTGCATLFFGAFLCVFLGIVRNEKDLLANGEAVMGSVLKARVFRSEQTYDSSRSVTTQVDYSFLSPSGERKGSDSAPSDLLDSFDDGGPLIVLYFPRDKSSAKPYLFFRWVELSRTEA